MSVYRHLVLPRGWLPIGSGTLRRLRLDGLAVVRSSVPGIFAAGDVRHGSVKRVASGVGEGSTAIAFVHQYLAQRTAPADAQ